MQKSDSEAKQVSARFFYLAPPDAAQSGWYYRAREGLFGPFASRESAQFDLAHRIAIHPMQRASVSHEQEASTDDMASPTKLTHMPDPYRST